ncbi:10995_t:CDS:2 [Diversispora eburnea]|uniref:10995_t:CDS:1 n=1 Tax=Diversispora eburnea TaxID=1213867 RepID=A0A9N9BQV9_9GLOM|nr:10995_t:CDS:2 [Diversispora eburnea]
MANIHANLLARDYYQDQMLIKLPMEQINEILDQQMILDEVLITNLTEEDDERCLKGDPKQLDDLLKESSKGNNEN